MIISIESNSAVPPYEQLRQQMQAMITSGVLRSEDRIPPIRQLAKDLDLAAGTVNRAIRELETEGWLETRGHRGTFVRTRSETMSSTARVSELDHAAVAYARNAQQLGFSKAAALEAVRTAFDQTAEEGI